MKISIWLSALVAAQTLALLPRPAAACVCGSDRQAADYPQDGAEDVPLDALLWTNRVLLQRLERYWVVDDATMTPVEGNWSEIRYDFHSISTFAPTRGWKPETAYSLRYYDIAPPEAIIEYEGVDALENYETVLVRFETGRSPWAGETQILPPTYEIERLSGATLRRGSCDVSSYEVEVDISVPHTGRLLVIGLVADEAPVEVSTPGGSVEYFAGTVAEAITLGHNMCTGPWAGVGPGDVGHFRFGTYDVTGAVHWYPRTITIELPELVQPEPPAENDNSPSTDEPDGTGGCSQTPSALTTLGVGLALLGMVRTSLRGHRRRWFTKA